MSQKQNYVRRLSQRQQRLLVALLVYGESRVSRLDDDFDVTKDTLRRDLDGLADAGYVDISKELVGGAANPAFVYSLTDTGGEVANEVSVSDKNESVLESLDEQSRRIAELEAEVSYLRRQTAAQEHYLRQLLDIVEIQGYEIESWSQD